MKWNYPRELPVVKKRSEVITAIRSHQVVVLVSETGSGKTTQLPKMVAEAIADTNQEREGRKHGWIACTQPRRIAASSVAQRVAEELGDELGKFVGYRVRFQDHCSEETRIKFMTDGILLAETQSDPKLRKYDAIIIDEAHERSLNIDFLLGYLKRLLLQRPDLKLVISSATLDAGAFSQFFGNCPVIEAEGRTFPVEEVYLPPNEDEEEGMDEAVLRAVRWITEMGERGDILVFLPGEREIRDCLVLLEEKNYRDTEVVPLYARLSLAEQQRVFRPGAKRRIVLATNVAETSLTIPRIVCVIDTGMVRMSRWNTNRGVQRLQTEEVSQASARQRKGRCGRIREGICVRLYSEENLEQRAEFTDPEIRRSSLAGVILRMKALRLPEISEFPFLDPPNRKAVSAGYRTLRELGAIDKKNNLTEEGRVMARLPIDPRFAKILLTAQKEEVLAEMIPVVAALEIRDPRERPKGKEKEADKRHQQWKHEDSDFLSILLLWIFLQKFRNRNKWQNNQLRKFCKANFMSFLRIREWGNIVNELTDRLKQPLDLSSRLKNVEKLPDYASFHRALLSGVPRQFGLWDRESRSYRLARGGFCSVFPGSYLFGGKPNDWVLGMELVETGRLYARRLARIEPEWVEQVAPHLCRKRYSNAYWEPKQGAVYAKETVLCSGLLVVAGRPVHYGRINPEQARKIFILEGLMQGGVTGKSRIVDRLSELREEVQLIEHKLRRRDGLWSEEGVISYFEKCLPEGMCTAKAFHRWSTKNASLPLPDLADVSWEIPENLEQFPDWIGSNGMAGDEFPLYYHDAPGERDDGVSIGVHIDQLAQFPDFLPSWGVDGDLEWRAECLIRSLPKEFRRLCQPVATRSRDFSEQWRGQAKHRHIHEELAEFLSINLGREIEPGLFKEDRLPECLITKVWICDDAGEELAFGSDIISLKRRLLKVLVARQQDQANSEWESYGWKKWPSPWRDTDSLVLPESVESNGVKLYPALVAEQQKSVGTRAFHSESEAHQAQRGGIVNLLMLSQAEMAAYIKKKLPLDWAVKSEWFRRGGSIDEFLKTVAEGSLEVAPWELRDVVQFSLAAERARGNWWECGVQLGRELEQVFTSLAKILDELHRIRGHRILGGVAADIDEQLAWLLRPEFCWKAGYDNVRSYSRYFHAIDERLQRLNSLPPQKDLEKMERFQVYGEPWYTVWMADPDDSSLWQYGWLLEEYRISLFAPSMSCKQKVGERILRQLW